MILGACAGLRRGVAHGHLRRHKQKQPNHRTQEAIVNGLFEFMASTAGRVARIIAGLALILIGPLALGGIWGWILAIVGLVPLLAGVFDRCVFAPLFSLPFGGEPLRQALRNRAN